MLIDALAPWTLWIKVAHIVAVICWMAAMLYLPRLFVYHCGVKKNSAEAELLSKMEWRLAKFIMLPAMLIVWLTGLWLAYSLYDFMGGWLHVKITAIVLMSGFHGFLAASLRRFAKGENKYSAKTWRILNEAPTVLMIIAVIMVIVKPF